LFGLEAPLASVTLEPLIALIVFASFDRFDFAVMTRHCDPCLFSGDGSQWICLESLMRAIALGFQKRLGG
jgi:hypothetical protein